MGARYTSRDSAHRRNGDKRPPSANDYDPLLPVQYYERVAGGQSPSGEFRLFFAILEDALRCYVRAKDCRSGAKRAEFVDAREWFFTRGIPQVFSFESICSFLGLDPDWLRSRLDSLGPADFPLKQFRTRRRRPVRPSASRAGSRREPPTVIAPTSLPTIATVISSDINLAIMVEVKVENAGEIPADSADEI
jgi:hypothetical protein